MVRAMLNHVVVASYNFASWLCLLHPSISRRCSIDIFFPPSLLITSTMPVSDTLSLDPRSLASMLGVLFILYFVVSTLVSWYQLRCFKGPKLAAFSYLWVVRLVMSERPDVRYADTQKEYGEPLVRIAPDRLMTDDPEVLRRINSVRSGYKRSSWYNGFRVNPKEHNMISTTDDELHDFIKSQTAGGYSFRDVPSMESDINGTINEFMTLLRTMYLSTKDNTRPVDWANVAQYFTLDTLSKVAFGKEFGCLAANSDIHDFMASSKSGMRFMTLCAELPWMRSILTSRLFLNIAGPKTTDLKGVGALMR